MLAEEGPRGISHLKVDRAAAVPDGTTSFHFRTRSSLLQAIAGRLSDLDLADLAAITQEVQRGDTGSASLLAEIVFASGREPRLSRTRARYELALESRRDADLGELLQRTVVQFMALTRAVVAELSPGAVDNEALDEQNMVVLAFLNGLLMSLARGDFEATSAQHIDRLLRSIVRGVHDGRAGAQESPG